MNIENNSEYILITINSTNLNDFFTFLKEQNSQKNTKNIIVKFNTKINLTNEDILLLLEHSNLSYKNGKSFIIFGTDLDVDELPDSLNIVPTFEEALDVIEMEDIERDLGF